MSSHFYKSSSLAFAILLATTSLSRVEAQEFTITDNEVSDNRFIGINIPTEDFLDDVVVTTGDLPEGHNYIYGIQVNDHDITFHGNVNVDANATTPGALAYGLRAQENGNLTVLGDTILHVSTQVPTQGSQGNATGVLAQNAVIDLSAGSTSITIDAGSSRPYGFQIVGGGDVTVGSTLVTMNVHNATDPSNSGSGWVHALYSAGGVFTAKENVTFVVNGLDEAGNRVNLGSRAIRVVNLEGSAYSTNAYFQKDLSIRVDADTDTVHGIYVSGDTASNEDLHAGATIDGLLDIDISGAMKSAVGIYAQGESGVSADRVSISIDSQKDGGWACGVYSLSNPSSYPGPGDVNIDEGLVVDVRGQGQATGVRSVGVYDNRASVVNIGGASQITVISEQDSAFGVVVEKEAEASLSNVTATVQSFAENGEAIGLDLSSASLTLKGNHFFKVEGARAVGIDAASTDVHIEGSAQIIADQALNADAESVFNVAGSDSRGNLVLNGNVTNSGTVNLENADLMVSDTTEKAVLGTVNTVGSQESSVVLGGGEYEMTAFNGEDKYLVLTDLANTERVTIGSKTGNLGIVASGDSNDQYVNAEAAAKALSEAIVIKTDEDGAVNEIEVLAGDVNDGLTAQRGIDGSLTNVRKTKNDKLDAYGSVAALSALSLRHEMNSLSKRMGELRDSPTGTGLWARAYGSEMEYGAQNMIMKSTSLQIGADRAIGDWRIGAAFTYTDGESDYDLGSADLESYSFALYGTWFVPCGAYVDFMAKYNRFENEFALNGMNGNYDSNAFGVSVETGYRFEFLQGGLFVEPQAGLNYGHIGGESFTAENNVTIDQDGYDSLIGRLGVRFGFKFPENKGMIYARVSGLYDFDGEINGEATKGDAHNTIEEDLGGAWIEMGIGANFNWSENTYTYVDLERTNGGDVKENYRWNIGIRHVF